MALTKKQKRQVRRRAIRRVKNIVPKSLIEARFKAEQRKKKTAKTAKRRKTISKVKKFLKGVKKAAKSKRKR